MSRIFKEMKSRQIIEILGSDPDMQKDLFKVLPEASYEVIFINVIEDEDYFYQVQLRKRME
jgi:hypothetical protein